MSNAFYGKSSFNDDISAWDTSNVTNMSSMFSGASSFNINIGNWNTSNVNNMSNMFYYASSLNKNIYWNTSNVTNMSYMFGYAIKFNGLFNDTNSLWDTSAVSNMSYMFFEASEFTKDISDWNTISVTNMSHMFFRSSNFNSNISNWNVQKVTSMMSMFFEASAFNRDISGWNTSKVTNMSYMFNDASKFDQNITIWNTLAVTTYSSMFKDASAMISTYGSNSDFNTNGNYTPNEDFFNQFPPSEDILLNQQFVSQVTGLNLWSALLSISSNGTYMVIGIYNPAKVYYSINGGSTWNQSAINALPGNLSYLRGIYNSQNGKYSTFGNAIQNPQIYYSNDYGKNYNYIGRTGNSYFFNKTYVNETGTIVLITSSVYNGYYAPIFIGYINNENLSATSWSVVYKSGMGSVYQLCANSDFSFIYLPTNTGVYIFNDSDTLNLTNVNYWNKSTNTNLSNLNSYSSSSSSDNSVIVIVNANSNSKQIWFSTNSGTDFYNLYNNAISIFSSSPPSVSVSPNGQITALYGYGRTNIDIYLYQLGSNGSYTVLGVIGYSYYYGYPVQFVSLSNNNQIFINNDLYGNNSYSSSSFATINPSYISFDEPQAISNSNFSTIISDWNTNSSNTIFTTNTSTTYYGSIENWNTSQVTSMISAFQNNSTFNNDISNWDTTNVTTMENMFTGASKFNIDISNWNVYNVNSMYNMFTNTLVFNQNLNNWKINNVTTISGMFAFSSYNNDITQWKPYNLQNTEYMFQNNTNFNQNIKNWNTLNVTTYKYMFLGASEMQSTYSIGNTPTSTFFNQNWNTINYTYNDYLAAGASYNLNTNNANIICKSALFKGSFTSPITDTPLNIIKFNNENTWMFYTNSAKDPTYTKMLLIQFVIKNNMLYVSYIAAKYVNKLSSISLSTLTNAWITGNYTTVASDSDNTGYGINDLTIEIAYQD